MWSNWLTHRPFTAKIAGSSPVIPINDLVAQWTRAPGYGPGGWGFESSRGHQEAELGVGRGPVANRRAPKGVGAKPSGLRQIGGCISISFGYHGFR